MAVIRPFRAVRPAADKAEQVSCVPYDVVHEDEVRGIITRNPLSFIRVTRAEGEFPPGAHPTPAEVFARARANLEQFIRDGVYSIDQTEAIYIYQLASETHTQTGVVACCSLEEYEQGLIKKHEHVRPDKVADRTEHLLAVGAQTGLIFLAFRDTSEIRSLMEDATEEEPIYRFECPKGVVQSVWRITDERRWTKAFAKVPALYVADGHHRVESADQARKTLRDNNPAHTGNEQYNFVVAGMFAAEDLLIMPYNRVVRDLNGLSDEDFFESLRRSFIVVDTIEKTPKKRGNISMYFKGQWYKLKFNVPNARVPDPAEDLDVSILQEYLMMPVLGIKDARTDERIGFVGGAQGTDELERLVDDGIYKVAFSLYPTTMNDLLAISDVGETMPPKSTWFEPKLKDGLLVHMIETPKDLEPN